MVSVTGPENGQVTLLLASSPAATSKIGISDTKQLTLRSGLVAAVLALVGFKVTVVVVPHNPDEILY